jgi:hypothetical protein
MTRIRTGTTTAVPFVLVGGVPGAGKSTVLRRLAPLLPGVQFLDSDTERHWFAQHSRRVPYRVLRPLVHLIHHLRVLTAVLTGPRRHRGLVVHDPSTRWVRLGLLGRLARLRGWNPEVLFVDVSRPAALAGQQQRRRVVNHRRFAGHWRRWRQLRAALGTRGEAAQPHWVWALTPWRTQVLSSRATAGRDLLDALAAAGEDSSIRSAARSVGGALSNGG